MVRLKIGSNDLFYHKLQVENVRSTYTVLTLCVFKYIQPYKKHEYSDVSNTNNNIEKFIKI